ncbi:substrate-binding periplasmic protein [Desulfobotulus sp.]|jgi:ABC-type amino acid transport substrate-binding protein|uniref:substrate-binding periplasmic protein n=1 Tax=Desulfobotulus sp. TaxID=1940337 RepID=UPI002A35B852|nr:transporter substrate-binding domain-containing protein [Desulfobotulus sp.]MDY0161973.1 transporter substrate-binding domain-containing protein [Desulfobotulus sp.]
MLLALLPGASGSLRADIPFLLASDPMPPWVEGEYGPTHQGQGVDLVSAIFARTGHAIQVVVHPWLRVTRMLEFGHIDGILLVQQQPSLSTRVRYSDPLFTSRTVLCYDTRKHPDFALNSLEDLAGYTLGLVTGQVPSLEQGAHALGLRVESLPSMDAGLSTLASGRIDFFIGTESNIRARMQTMPQALFLEIHPKALASQDLHIAIAKDSPAAALLPEINRIIAQMKADGSLARYLAPVSSKPAPRGEP